MHRRGLSSLFDSPHKELRISGSGDPGEISETAGPRTVCGLEDAPAAPSRPQEAQGSARAR